MKIIVFSIPNYTNPVLDALTNTGYEIIDVIRQSKSLKDDNFFEEFKKNSPDICVVAAYGKIIPKKYLDLPKYGFINIHPSLLPRYRGPSPIKTAILDGETLTGVSIMKVDEEMDHGPVISSIKYPISSDKYHEEIQKDLWELGAKLLIETLPNYISGETKPVPQDDSQATSTKKFTRQDGRINWSSSAEKIFNQIRALGDDPGVWTLWKGKSLNIRQAHPLTTSHVVSSTGLVEYVDNEIAVATGKCYLVLRTIQLEGRKETDAKSFVNGHPDFINSKLE